MEVEFAPVLNISGGLLAVTRLVTASKPVYDSVQLECRHALADADRNIWNLDYNTENKEKIDVVNRYYVID